MTNPEFKTTTESWPTPGSSTTTEFKVTGMSCGHCEHAITQEVARVAGVTGVEVSAATGQLRVTSSGALDDALVLAAVDEAGYAAVLAGAR